MAGVHATSATSFRTVTWSPHTGICASPISGRYAERKQTAATDFASVPRPPSARIARWRAAPAASHSR